MIKTRVIPVLLHSGTKLLKGMQFNAWRSVGHAMQAVRVHQQRNVDELIVLDISATQEQRSPDLNMVRSFADESFMPLSVGGGIRSVNTIRDLLANGADKVVIGTAAIFMTDLITKAAMRFGSQAIAVAVDVRGDIVHSHNGKYSTDMGSVQFAREMQQLGAGELIVTDITREGMMDGYNLPLIEKVAQAVNIPVIANGGAGKPEHMAEALKAGAHAVAAGALFQFTDHTPRSCAQWLNDHGFATRLAA